MSEIQSTTAAGSAFATGARAAIANAAEATGVDFDFLLAQAKLESGLDPSARAGTSSATGLYQFVGGTWLDTLKKHGAEHGLGWAANAASDPALRAQAMALRTDPQASALMAAELAADNKAALTATLGREPDSAELYLAHFLGAEGASRFLGALANDPAQSAAAILPAAAAANRGIFYAGGSARSLGEVMGLVRGKLAGAMEGGDGGEWAADAAPATTVQSTGGPIARAFSAAASSAAGTGAAAGDLAQGRSMAETLRDTFAIGSGGDSAVPGHVRAAYGRLSALGL